MLYPDLRHFNRIAVDTETDGFHPHMGHRPFMVSVSLPNGEDFCYDFRYDDRAKRWFDEEMRWFDGVVYCHNVSFDYRMLSAADVYMPLELMQDTCISAVINDEQEHSYSLENLSRQYCRSHKKGQLLYDALAVDFGGRKTKNVQMANISKSRPGMYSYPIVKEYAEGDTRCTLELADYYHEQLTDDAQWAIHDFEHKVMPVLIAAEMRGIRVDVDAAQQAVMETDVVVRRGQKELNSEVGFAVNVNAPESVKKVFKPVYRDGEWYTYGGEKLGTTDAGNASLSAPILRELKDPLALQILELRSMIKTRDTFLMGHILESEVNGRVYPNINQNKGEDGGTGTGRLSYTDPALQQIPSRNKTIAAIIKSIFLPEVGHEWLEMDMASFEVRIFADLVGTADIIRKFTDDPETDFHQFVADLTGLPRDAAYVGQAYAKALNLGMIFNQGKGATAEKMGMPWEWDTFTNDQGDEITFKRAGYEAKRIIDRYHHELPGVQALADSCKDEALIQGYIETAMGRRFHFPRGFKAYKASGIKIQATAADLNKENWLLIDRVLRDTGANMMLNTHDSYSVSCPIGMGKELAPHIKDAVEQNRSTKVPLILEINKPGINWWAAYKNERML